MLFTQIRWKARALHMGPSKNYVTARGGEGVTNFVTYRYVYFEGVGGYSMT